MKREEAVNEAARLNSEHPEFPGLFFVSLIGYVGDQNWQCLMREITLEERSKIAAGILPDPDQTKLNTNQYPPGNDVG